MIEDMTVRGFGEKTQNDYIRHVKNFTIFLGRSPGQARPEDLRRYQVHQREQGVQPPTMNSAVAALRFFFTTTCNRPETARHLTLVRQPQKLPVVLTPEEVARLIQAAPGPKYKAALAVAYGAGLRVSEVANLRVLDIDGAIPSSDSADFFFDFERKEVVLKALGTGDPLEVRRSFADFKCQ